MPPSRASCTTAAMDTMKPISAYTLIFTRSTLMPESLVVRSLEPTAYMWRPKAVCLEIT